MSKQSRDVGRTERAAAVRAEQARKERNRRVLVIVGIVVLLGAVVAAGAWYGGGGGNNTASTSSSSSSLKAGDASLVVGKDSAPVKVVVYEDFLCPFCRELETSTRDFLAENADKGKVQVTYQPIHLLQQYAYSGKALNAWAAVLEHASPAAALKLHNILYDNQPYEQSSGTVTDAQIAAWVKQAGADTSAVRDAMKSQDTTFFAAAQKAMTDAHITGTPTVFINGKELPLSNVTTMVSQLEAAVQQGS